MIAEVIILIVAVLFLILSICLFNGKGKWFIAGYNTATNQEKKKINEKKMCRAVGFICLVTSCMLFIMAYMGYKVDSGALSENVMLPFGLIFAAVIIITLVLATRYMNKNV